MVLVGYVLALCWFGPFWVVIIRLWVILDSFGSFWVVVAQFGWLWVVQCFSKYGLLICVLSKTTLVCECGILSMVTN